MDNMEEKRIIPEQGQEGPQESVSVQPRGSAPVPEPSANKPPEPQQGSPAKPPEPQQPVPQSPLTAQKPADIPVPSEKTTAPNPAVSEEKTEPATAPEDPEKAVRPRVKPGLADVLAGEAKDFNANIQPHLPSELIGGSIPHVFGTEDEAVWNAAAQACGTERVHYTYTVESGRVWYLACPSATVASNPDSWCPLAAALPGNSEHWDKETVYLYEQEGMAAALRWDPETGRMQVFLGATRTILPRMQSMDANFVTINPETAHIARWKNRTLRTEKLSRALIRTLILMGMGVGAIATFILLVSVVSIGFIHGDLSKIKQETDDTATELMQKAAEVMQSDTIWHMTRVQNLLDNLAQANGYLVKYEVSGKKTEWNAIVPTGLSDQARTDTSYLDAVGKSVKKYVPKVKKEDEDNVRLIGKK